MKVLKRILFLCLLAMLAACTENAFIPESEIVPTGDGSTVDLISMVVPDIEMDATTRSKLIDDGSQLKFEWQENDAIGVVPMTGRPLSFPIHAENAGKNTALFDGGGWALRTDMKYAAFFPIDGDNQETDISHIAVDYTGQTQGNFTKYDFLATGAVKPSNGQVTFNMQRMSAILKISITMPAGSSARYVTMVTTPLIPIKGTMDLSGTTPVYEGKEFSKFIHTDAGIETTYTTSGIFEFYVVIPPVDLTGYGWDLRITSDSNNYVYAAHVMGENFEAGKAYYMSGVASDALLMNQNLIAAVESYYGITFDKDDNNYVNVNTNLASISQVNTIVVRGKNDPYVCTEIGYFRNLITLSCENNKITSLDLSNNKILRSLNCSNNNLTSLDVSKNSDLLQLKAGGNQLTSLDVSKNSELEMCVINSNPLTSLDVSKNLNLKELNVYGTQLPSLDISKNTKLSILNCNGIKLTSLDISNNLELTELNCTSNNLTSLDVSKHLKLKDLRTSKNLITSLDVSNNTALEKLVCDQVNTLDISHNTELTELNVGKSDLTSLDLSNNTKLLHLVIQNCSSLTSLDISNNTALIFLQCTFTSLTSIDVSHNTAMIDMYIYCNQLTRIDGLSSCKDLDYFYCYSNKLTSLDVSSNTEMTCLYCFDNQLTSLDVSHNTKLADLYCQSNRLTSLNLSNCPNLTWDCLYCGKQTTNSGVYVYNKVTPNTNLWQYYLDNGTIPACAESKSNYYVEMNGVKFPAE